MISIDQFREQFVAVPDLIHLNNAGQSPMCAPARAAMKHWADALYEKGAHGFGGMFSAAEEARGSFAAFMGAKKDEIAWFPSTSTAVSQVAFGLDLKAGDEVIVWDQEYPANFYPWLEAAKRSGAKLVVARSEVDSATPVAAIEKFVTARTRAIAFSWVQFQTGALTDLAEVVSLARKHGIFTCADVIQGAGLYPFHFEQSGLDAVCGGSHKWIASAHGAGFMILREEHHTRFAPQTVGAITYGTPDTPLSLAPALQSGPARFEPGGRAFVEIICLGEAAKLLGSVGVENIAAESARLGERLMEGLLSRGYTVNTPHVGKHPGGIVNFAPGKLTRLKTMHAISEALGRAGVSHVPRGPGMRLSPHAFNTTSDIDRTLVVL